MPLSIRIIAAPLQRQAPWVVDSPPWLELPVPEPSVDLRPVLLTAGHRDSIAVITWDELKVWHARDRKNAFEGIYAGEAWQKQLRPKLAEFEAMLVGDDPPLFVVVHEYEWESGYG